MFSFIHRLPSSSLSDLASLRKKIKARDKDIISIPEVVSMQQEIQPSRIIEIAPKKTQDLLKRYGVAREPEPVKLFCVFCSKPEEDTTPCSYGLPHEFSSSSVIAIDRLCIRCGLHPRQTKAILNGCNHRLQKETSTKVGTKVIEPKKEVETKPEEKKSPKKMKRWPDGRQTLSYRELVAPVKAVLEKGYRLIRRPEVEEVEYDGYNIGRHELTVLPTPKDRLTKGFLKFEQSCGNSLADVALNVLFLLGVEQGRRSERKVNNHIDKILATLKLYRDTNKDLRTKVDELESYIDVKRNNPDLSDRQLEHIVSIVVFEKRSKRLAVLQRELETDPTAVAAIKRPERTRFANVLGVSNIISTDTSKDQWKAYLNEVGWTYEEWKRACKKKKVRQLKFKKV